MKQRGKVLYMVWADVPSQVEDEWNKWVDQSHIPEVMAKESFLSARKFIVREGTTPRKHVTIYEAKDMASLEKYVGGPAKALRDDYDKRYGAAVKLSRIILEELTYFEGR